MGEEARKTLPLGVLCKDVILNELNRMIAQGCDSKRVRCGCDLRWIDSEGFERSVSSAGRASIGT